MREYLKFIKRYKMAIPLVTILAMGGVRSFLSSYYSKVISNITKSIGTDAVNKYLIMLIIVSISSVALFRIATILSAMTREKVSEKYRNDMYESIINASTEELQTFNISKLTVAIQYAYDVADKSIAVPSDIINCIVLFMSSIIIMAISDIKLTIIVLISCIPLLIIFNLLQRNLDEYIKNYTEAYTKINTLSTRLAGYETIKSFVQGRREINEFKKATESYKNAAIKKKSASLNATTIIWALHYLLDIIIIAYCINTVTDMNDIISKIILFISLNSSIINPLSYIGDIIDKSVTTLSHISDNNKILEIIPESNGELAISSFNDSIKFDNVSFCYDHSNDFTLKNINIEIPKGCRVGIYGASGSGKSTFTNLINKFFIATDGNISIDGHNLRDCTNSSLRRLIGNMSQEIFIFSDMSILDNIRYGCKYATLDSVIEAAKMANAHEFISKLPDGYNSMIGNNGIMLSGGERQRIALARLFLLDPPIIILDEATSKLDNESEVKIKESLNKLSDGKTVISIAHRLTTIEDSDILIGIKDNEIYECGDADYIKENGELYKSLYK